MTRRNPIHYGNRFEVSAWTPPAWLRDLASERIEGMVGYFLSCARRRDCMKWQDDLSTLARSCYLQGVHDAVDAAARTRMNEHARVDQVE
jgi:hypothetical protein